MYRTKLLFLPTKKGKKRREKNRQSDVTGMERTPKRLCGFKRHLLRGCLDLSSPSFFVPKRTGSVLTLYIDETISFPFSALIGITRQKMCALAFESCFVFQASCLAPFFPLFFSCLNETAPVVCYEKKKANNPSPNNRAELKKKILAPGCPSASGPGIRLQLAQLHSLAQAIFSGKGKKT